MCGVNCSSFSDDCEEFTNKEIKVASFRKSDNHMVGIGNRTFAVGSNIIGGNNNHSTNQQSNRFNKRYICTVQE